MRTFEDANKRQWTIPTLDAPTIKQVRNELKVDLAPIDHKKIDDLATDCCLLVDVLYVLCREEAKAANISDVQFGQALVGDAIEDATVALIGAISDFFPQRKRLYLTKLRERNQALETLALDKAMEAIEDPEAQAQVLAALDDAMKAQVKATLIRLNGATNTLASLASAPSDSGTTTC